jgi:hypothetical protein
MVDRLMGYPVYQHLLGTGAEVYFLGIEESWLPLGIGRTHREVTLAGLGATLSFLDQ